MKARAEALKRAQQALGCPGCRFCDNKAHLKGEPCCTYFGKLLVAGDKCLVRMGREARKGRKE